MSQSIDPGQPLPVYVQLKTLLMEQILSGRYGQGDRLPTEHELCALHGISRTPVHRALTELAEEGVILRHRRTGTFVNPHWLSRQGNRSEVRVVVPEGPWEDLVRQACPDDLAPSVAATRLEDLHQVLTHAVAEGRAPDLALLDSVWVHEFAASGFLLPLDELDAQWLEEEYLGDVLPAFVRANEYDGRPVAVQAEADVVGLWYRRAVLDDAGIGAPRTWSELARAGTTLRRAGVERPLALPVGSRGGETTSYCLLGLLATNGVRIIDGEQVTIAGSGTVELLTFLRRLARSEVLSVDAVTYEHDRALRMLAAEQAVLAIGGSYEFHALAEATGQSPDAVWETFGFAAPPRGPRGGASTLAGGMVHAIFRQAANPHGAMRLLRNLASPRMLTSMSQLTGQLPPRRSAAETLAATTPFLGATAQLLDGAAVRPATRTYPRVSFQLQSMLEGVMVGRLPPRQAARRAAELIGAITGLPVQG